MKLSLFGLAWLILSTTAVVLLLAVVWALISRLRTLECQKKRVIESREALYARHKAELAIYFKGVLDYEHQIDILKATHQGDRERWAREIERRDKRIANQRRELDRLERILTARCSQPEPDPDPFDDPASAQAICDALHFSSRCGGCGACTLECGEPCLCELSCDDDVCRVCGCIDWCEGCDGCMECGCNEGCEYALEGGEGCPDDTKG